MSTINIDKRGVPVTARNKRIYPTTGTSTSSTSTTSSGSGSSIAPDVTLAYVDGSLGLRDTSINWLKNNTWKTSVLLLKEASLNMSKFKWAGGLLEPSVAGVGGGTLDSVTSAGNTTANNIQTGNISIQQGSASLSISGTVDDTETLRFFDDGGETLSLWSDNFNVPTSNYLKTWNTFYIKYGEVKKLLIDSANTETYNNFKVQKQLPVLAISSSTGSNSIEKLQFVDNGSVELEVVSDNTVLDTTYINAFKPFSIKYNNVDKLKVDNTGVSSSSLEASLGVPAVNGYVLSSTTSGVRTWVANGSGGGTYTAWTMQPQDNTGSGTSYQMTNGKIFNLSASEGIALTYDTLVANTIRAIIAPEWGTTSKTVARGNHLHTNVYEPSLGNPAVNGYVLNSTTSGIRGWVPMTGGVSQTYVDGSLALRDASIAWVAAAGVGVKQYIDGSLALRDNSINWLNRNTWQTSIPLLKEASIGAGLAWNAGKLDVSIVGGGGSQGIQGIQGRQGTQGTTGSGSQGTQGTTGIGSQGTTGSQGVQGITGAGSQGVQGIQGRQGTTGTGTQGTQGTTGAGSQGVQGIQGVAGGGGGISGSGTANTITKFTAGTTIGNSSITDDGSRVTVPGYLYAPFVGTDGEDVTLQLKGWSDTISMDDGYIMYDSGMHSFMTGATNIADFSTTSINTAVPLVFAGNASIYTAQSSGLGKHLSITAGDHNGSGFTAGSLLLAGGRVVGGSGGNGGDVRIIGGKSASGTGTGGNVYIDGENGTAGKGSVYIGTNTSTNAIYIGSLPNSNTGNVLYYNTSTKQVSYGTAGGGSGTVTSVTAGNGMTQSGTSTINPTLDIVSQAGTSGSVGTIDVRADAIGVSLGTTDITAAAGNHIHPNLYEPSLGIPSQSASILLSSAVGVRSWQFAPVTAKLATTSATSGTGEVKLFSCAVPANRVVSAGDSFHIRMMGNSSSTGTLIFRIRVGANNSTADNQCWISTTSAAQVANARAGIDCTVTLRSSTTVIADGVATAGAVVLPTLIAAPATAAITSSSNWFIVVTATCSVGTYTAQTCVIDQVF